jgi:predicted permease
MLAAFLPVWILTGLGYTLRRFNVFNDATTAALGRFVFQLAMPAAIYLTLAATPLSGFRLGPLLAFTASTVAIIGTGWALVSRLWQRKPAERPIWGMAAGYVNSANLGIPIAMQVLGDLSFLVQVVLVQVLVITPAILMALDRHRGTADGRGRLRQLASLPLRNPVIIGSVVGVAASATHWREPAPVHTAVFLLAAAAVPAALIALGASLRREEPIAPVPAAELGAVVALKLLAQPLAAFVVGSWIFGLPPAPLLAVVVCAGLPTAQNTFIYAQEYGVAEALAGRAVIVSTAASLVSLAAISAWLS